MDILERIYEAMVRLGETDIPFANLKSDEKLAEEKAKTVKAEIFKHETGTVADRQAAAQTSEEYWAAFKEYVAVYRAALTMQNQREHEERAIEVGRTIEASRRKA